MISSSEHLRDGRNCFGKPMLCLRSVIGDGKINRVLWPPWSPNLALGDVCMYLWDTMKNECKAVILVQKRIQNRAFRVQCFVPHQPTAGVH